MSKSGIYRCVCILVVTLFAALSGVHLQTSLEERTSILKFAAQPLYNLRSGQQLFQTTTGSHSREPSSSIILPANNQIQAASASIHQRSPSHSRTIAHNDNERLQNASSIDGKFLNQEQILTVSRQAKPTTFIDSSHQILNKEGKSSLVDHQQQQQIDGAGRNLLRGTIEMALRQTSSDESYFQAPRAIDWTMASRHDLPPTVQTSGSAAFLTTSRAISLEQDQTTTTESSQTEESNLILDGSSASSSTESIYEPTSDQQERQQSTTSSTNLEYEQRATTLVSPLSTNRNGSTGPSAASAGSFELSNNVVYEGPATAPPAGDFYFPFSDSNKLPNGPDADNYRAPNVWW